MGDFLPTLSGLTGGSYLNAMVYTLEIIQLVSYIKHFWKKDRLLTKIIVLACFFIDTICTIAIFSWVLMYSVVHWGDQEYLFLQTWPTPAYVICTVCVSALVQSFLISRYYTLSSQRLISIVLGIFLLAAFAGGMAVAISLIFFSTYADRSRTVVTSIVWLGSSAIADILIALSLVLTLSRAGSGSTIRSTKILIKRLILVAVQSGTVTTLLAVLTLATYVAKPSTNDSGYFAFCLGRAYTLTMLFNLNLRKDLQEQCHACGINTLAVITGTVPHQGEGNKTLQSGIRPAERHCLGSIQARSSLDTKELASAEDSDMSKDESCRVRSIHPSIQETNTKGCGACHAPDASSAA